MAKAKTTHILVLMKSMVTKHKFPALRPRQAEQLELIKFDPFVRRDVLYKEMKKIKGVKT
ncbi:unnamed protein product [Larinioides sclopetarius]|uniref:Large ribosomal subunit protein bL33m n=1 Tax=Larinioides sclopetarius TaxID=280406 RepID=A0AAV2AKF2_9ARAC